MEIICSIFWNSQTMFGATASHGRGLNVGNFHTGINYPTSPIIRRQGYLNAPPADLATPLRYFGSCEPQTAFGASHSGAWATILGGPEIPQCLWHLSLPAIAPWSEYPSRHFGRAFKMSDIYQFLLSDQNTPADILSAEASTCIL